MPRLKIPHFVIFSASILFAADCSALSKEVFFEKRAALIEKYSKEDTAIPALHELQAAEDTFSKEFWRFKIDQYLYGQYKDFQPIYDRYRDGKAFTEIYDLDLEGPIAAKESSLNLPEIPEGHFSANLPGNTHTGSTLFVDGKVYIAYQGELTDPYIASYDIEKKVWDGPYKAGNSTLSKNGRQIDSHGRPSLEINGDGHLHILFGGHGGEWADGLNPMSFDTPHAGGRMLHVASQKPHDISAWEQKNDISPFASYTATCKMDNGDIYFFTRAGTHKSPWVYYKMENGSQSFEPPVIITWPTIDKKDPINVDTFYINPKKISETEIVVTALWHSCNFREYHNKETYARLNTYYMTLDTTDDTFYNVEGKRLELPITKAKADKMTLAYDSEATGETCFGTDPLPDQDGNPAAAYVAKGPGYREQRMVLYKNGEWTHSLPMPGTESRTLVNASGNPIKNVMRLAKIDPGPQASSAVVIYQDDDGQTVFASATSRPELGTQGQDWKVDEVYAAVPGARMEMQAVRNELGEAVAVILNIRKADSQRLYLWRDGAFQAND